MYICCKIVELLDFFTTTGSKIAPEKIIYNCYSLKEYHYDVISSLSEFICKNQGKIPQFNYNAAEKHKNIKKVMGDDPNNIELIKKYCAELSSFIENELDEIFDINKNLILNYFKTRSKFLPRISIKAEENGKIVDLYRDDWEYFSDDQTIADNSGSEHVFGKGKFFLCNDIIDAIHKEKYNNSRINCWQLRSHLKNHKRVKDHSEWTSFWKHNVKSDSDENIRPSPESCYQSTLIIPMTLYRNELSEDFRTHFEIPKQNSGEEKSRAIWGLLCLDHRESSYFDELDVSVGYIWADILSLYLINALMYTDHSCTFNNATDAIQPPLR